MTIDKIQPDVNLVIGELSLQIANLARENAILKATVQVLKAALGPQQILDSAEL